MKYAEQNRIQSFAYIISVCVAICCSFGFVTKLEREQFKIELESRINPNDAPEESLIRLPGLGPGRAGAIVTYREDFDEKTAGSPAFQNSDDLQKVKGIGPKTAKNVGQWLTFELKKE
jgi:competence ComEA-like helix-hairpin-helix protein